jgi:hypothetical protein
MAECFRLGANGDGSVKRNAAWRGWGSSGAQSKEEVCFCEKKIVSSNSSIRGCRNLADSRKDALKEWKGRGVACFSM